MAPVPQLPGTLGLPSIVTPEGLAAHHAEHGWMGGHEPPRAAILTYHKGFAQAVLAREPATHVPYFFGDLHLLQRGGGAVVLASGFGIGAPAAAFLLEDLAGAGVHTVVSVGTCGGLQPDLRLGELLVCDEAVRDEGTSHHYVADAERAHGDPRLADELAAALGGVRRGAAWTTDAPYRETTLAVRHWRAAGVLAVEMEQAALFTVGAVRGVAVGAILTVSDILQDEDWTPEFHAAETMAGLERGFAAAFDVCAARTGEGAAG